MSPVLELTLSRAVGNNVTAGAPFELVPLTVSAKTSNKSPTNLQVHHLVGTVGTK